MRTPEQLSSAATQTPFASCAWQQCGVSPPHVRSPHLTVGVSSASGASGVNGSALASDERLSFRGFRSGSRTGWVI
jgi:hypothetical protein